MGFEGRLAGLPQVTQERLRWLWARSADRSALARRTDLPREVTVELLKDVELAAFWAGVENRAGDEVDLAVITLTDTNEPHRGLLEIGRLAVAKQTQLSTASVGRLIQVASGGVARALLERDDLHPDHVVPLVEIYFAGKDELGQSHNLLRERIARSEVVAKAVLARAGLSELHLVSMVVDSWGGGVELRDAILESLVGLSLETKARERELRIQNTLTQTLSAFQRIGWRILRCADLRTDELEYLKGIHSLGIGESEITWRKQMNFSELLNRITCGLRGDCFEVGHLDTLQLFSEQRHRVEVPTAVVARALVAHFSDEHVPEWSSLIDTSRFDDLRRLACQYEQVGWWEGAVRLSILHNSSVLDHLQNPVPVLRSLASVGNRQVLHNRNMSRWADQIVEYFQPLHLTLDDPVYLQLILNRIEAEGGLTAEIALTLLPEWVGTLEELLQSARSLALP